MVNTAESGVDEKTQHEEAKAITAPVIDIYDQQAIFIAPMFIIHTGVQRSLSFKLSLQRFIDHGLDPCRAQLSLLNRQFNKHVFL
jgi:hypothetical protein